MAWRPAGSTSTLAELAAAIRDLGGHDLGLLVDIAPRGRPAPPHDRLRGTRSSGRGLPTEGHPNNHSALLTAAQMVGSGGGLGGGPGPAVAAIRRHAGSTYFVRGPGAAAAPGAGDVAATGRHPGRARASAPQAGLHPGRLGRFLADLAHDAPEAARPGHYRAASTSPRRPTSAAGSTRPGCGRCGTGTTGSPTTPSGCSFAGARISNGQHIELGIAEVNLVGLLGELGDRPGRAVGRAC